MNLFHFGFSKCGTSSIYDFFLGFSPTKGNCLKTSQGRIEFNFLRDSFTDADRAKLEIGNCYLKYSAGAFNVQTTKNLCKVASSFPDPVFLLSVRSPADALRSWFNMHKRIAAEGLMTDHFAVKERDKYLALSLDDYAHEWISKVDYARLIRQFVEVSGPYPTYIIDFRKVRLGTVEIMGTLLEDIFPHTNYSTLMPKRNTSAEKKSLPELSFAKDVQEECNLFERNLNQILDDPKTVSHLLKVAGKSSIL